MFMKTFFVESFFECLLTSNPLHYENLELFVKTFETFVKSFQNVYQDWSENFQNRVRVKFIKQFTLVWEVCSVNV